MLLALPTSLPNRMKIEKGAGSEDGEETEEDGEKVH